jgi:hypothetical protein
MTLCQQVEQVIGGWLGTDAAERDALRPQLVRDLIELIRSAPEDVATQAVSMVSLAMAAQVPGSQAEPNGCGRSAANKSGFRAA